MEDSDPFADALGRLSEEGYGLEIADRTFRIVDPVRGDAGAAALRLLGMVQAAAPVGVATYGETQVAAAVWVPPRLFVVRWARNRWVVGYRLNSGSRPNDYVRSEGRIPGHFEVGNWYESVPEDVADAFLGVGLDLSTAPFAVPAQPELPAPPARRGSAPEKTASARPAPRPRVPKAPKVPKPPALKPPAPRNDKLCLGCNMRRTLTQFEPGSDLCVDCRA